jgi:uncharacterized Tic20 family protein
MPIELDRELPDAEIRRWAMFCHLGGLACVVMTPMAAVVISLVLWLARRRDSVYIDQQGREAVNFQSSMLLLFLAASAIVWLLRIIVIGKLLFWVPGLVIILQVGGSIIGAIRAHDGESFQFPLILRFV